MTDETHERPFSRRAFLGTSVAATITMRGGVLDDSTAQAFALEEATIDDLQSRMRAGSESAVSLANKYLERIDAIDKRGPAINAVIELNPDALPTAAQLDAERKSGRVRGPLHGIPVLIKDNIDTADRMHTTAGSLALAAHIAARDAFIVAKLRAAGALILGKTNLSEWANFRSAHSSSGWSGRGGQTKNAYALNRTPSGSSSGSGAAVAANMCVVAIGTETDGSVTSPSAAESLVGIKPTIGLVSRSGIVPIAHSQDTAGPMARTVRDAAILLGVMTGADPNDAVTRDSPTKGRRDYTTFLDKGGLKGARIGVARKTYSGYHAETDKLLARALDIMKQAGATIVDPADIATAGQTDGSELDLLLYEFKTDLNAYLKKVGANVAVHSLADVIAFNAANAAREMPFFGQEIMQLAQTKGPLTEKAYLTDLERNRRLMGLRGIDATMVKHKLDAIVAPTQGPPWLIDLVNGDPSGLASFTSPAAVAGYPHVTVPMGFYRGLPIGLSFVGRAWSEPTLLKLAYAFEQTEPSRRKPTFAATADVS